MPSHSLNVLGLFCPLPVLLAVREMKHLRPGDLLEVIGDDPAILEDFPVWCRRSGHRLVHLSNDEGVIHVLVEKVATADLPPPSAQGASQP